MKFYNIKDFTRGWIIGNFDGAIIRTLKHELAVKYYKAGDYEPSHFHLKSDEITIIVDGYVRMNNNYYSSNDIIIIEKGEATDFECVTDTITTVFRTKSVPSDKFLFDENIKNIICSICKKEKVSKYFSIKDKKTNRLSKYCLSCQSDKQKFNYAKNRDKILNNVKVYREKNKDKINSKKNISREEYLQKRKIIHNDNKIKEQKYRQEFYSKNKDKMIARSIKYKKERLLKDPVFKIRHNVSTSINKKIFKQNKSIIKFLPYTISNLKIHLEKHFETWMNWSNHGNYNSKTWIDNDPSTWTWQIDHIIPHSTFKYLSMEDQSFKDCWALNNLRPLSAKQNLLKSNKL